MKDFDTMLATLAEAMRVTDPNQMQFMAVDETKLNNLRDVVESEFSESLEVFAKKVNKLLYSPRTTESVREVVQLIEALCENVKFDHNTSQLIFLSENEVKAQQLLMRVEMWPVLATMQRILNAGLASDVFSEDDIVLVARENGGNMSAGCLYAYQPAEDQQPAVGLDNGERPLDQFGNPLVDDDYLDQLNEEPATEPEPEPVKSKKGSKKAPVEVKDTRPLEGRAAMLSREKVVPSGQMGIMDEMEQMYSTYTRSAGDPESVNIFYVRDLMQVDGSWISDVYDMITAS